MTEHIHLRDGERLDNLMRGGLRIIQRNDVFRFGTDAVLLADFAAARDSERVCDLGTGCGILPLLLIGRAPALTIDAIEVQPVLADMALRSVHLNGLDESIRIYEMDLRNMDGRIARGAYNCVVCNPPYGRAGSENPSENEAVRIARHEVLCTLDDITAAASGLLRNGGRLCLIHRAERTADVLAAMRAHTIEPKAIRFIHHRATDKAKLVLFEGRKLAGPGLTALPPLILRNPDGTETPELVKIYGNI